MNKESADRGPLLGALLRLAHQSLVRRVLDALSEAGYDDIQASHFVPMQALWDYPQGLRVTELAAKAKFTKQSMGELVDQLVRRGYLARVSDPDDGRAWRVRITPFGLKASRLARRIVRDVETDWSRRIGAKRIEDLRASLRLLLESGSE
ncbi:MAG TPA: MarR family transcriptional regulator [Planctomycetota bacterium]|nr:MarR family transcriptional regulator [Planctomycetota bacterium]